MSDGTVEDALKITLADYRLSRGEKRALAKVIEKFTHDEHRLARARHHAFKIAREELIIAWDFDVQTDEGLTQHALSMRGMSFDWLQTEIDAGIQTFVVSPPEPDDGDCAVPGTE